MHPYRFVPALLGLVLLASCGDGDRGKPASGPAIKEEAVNLRAEGTTLNSFVYYDSTATGHRPAIVVVPEWWGLTNYARIRARQLAGLGYIALALDMYGNGRVAADPKEAQALAIPFYQNAGLFAGRVEAALTYLRSRTETDTARLGAMGYCFGGSAVLNAARLGLPLKGVVSFHGDYPDTTWPKGIYKGQVLICHGAADSFVPMAKYETFRHRLDSAGVPHTDKVYADATHAFTNPAATETGQKFKMPIRYNGAADTASWNDMKAFWEKVFRP